MKLLLHVCCGPCTIVPLESLRAKGHEVTGYFYNPNIHPFKEFKKRADSMQDLASEATLPLILDDNYGLQYFMRQIVFKEDERCYLCYSMRIEKSVQYCAKNKFEAFSTTLLYSRYQNHTMLVDVCVQLADKYGVLFIYEDFRIGWQQGIDKSKELGLYRQPYCGCIYSEQERYDKNFRKRDI